MAATGIAVAKKDQTEAIKAPTAAFNKLVDIAVRYIEDQEEAAEAEAERLRRKNEEIRRRGVMDPMRPD